MDDDDYEADELEEGDELEIDEWEYLFVSYYTTSNRVAHVNGKSFPLSTPVHYLTVVKEKGSDGWELVSAVSPEPQEVLLIFKRMR